MPSFLTLLSFANKKQTKQKQKRRKYEKTNQKGVTLVELVIVIAVIAILSAILIPTFGNVIADANKTAAKEDARTAYQKFLVDNAEKLSYAGDEAYILVDAKVGADNKFTSVKCAFNVKDGSLTEVTAGEGDTLAAIKTGLEITTENTDILVSADAISTTKVAKTAFKLTGDIYIIYK